MEKKDGKTMTLRMLVDKNDLHSRVYIGGDGTGARRRYRAQLNSEVVLEACMDGRLNFSEITGVPAGVIHSFKVGGAMFDLGHPFFGELAEELVTDTWSRGKTILNLAVYHYSTSEPHLGCKAHGYDTEKAIACVDNLRKQFERVFGGFRTQLCTVVLGVETDNHGLVLHAIDDLGKTYDFRSFKNKDDEAIRKDIYELYPSLSRPMAQDLARLVCGNRDYLRKTDGKLSSAITKQLDHGELILALGRGLEFIFQSTQVPGDEVLENKALCIGPYNEQYFSNIGTALNIIRKNIEDGRASVDDGIVLFASALSNDDGFNEERARERAKFYEDQILRAIRGLDEDTQKFYKENAARVTVLRGVVRDSTRKLTVISEKGLDALI